ncbi:MAG: DUF748 domain-containing protein, partial [Zoogloea sp.]|nr:DUF748 domain-containing protein [Zoogloea sp.]
FVLKEPDGSGDAARFDELYVNLEAESIFRAAPVVGAIRLERPWVHLVRSAGNHYNYTDLVEEFLNKPDTEPKPHYALHNIQVSGGRIDFDDRPTGRRHVVSDLDLGIPFLSNLPSKLDVYVQPALSAKVNGAPFAIRGKARPFSDTREATVAINLHDVDLTGYFDYVPMQLGFKLPAGRLDTELVVAFSQPPDKPMALDVSGSAGLREVETVGRDGKPLVKFKALQVAVHSYDVLRGKLALDTLRLDAPEANVRRQRNGHLNLEALAPASTHAAPAASHASGKGAKPAEGFGFGIGELKLTDGRLDIVDELPAKPFHTEIEGLNLSLRKVGNQGGAPGAMEIALRTSSGEEFKEHGTLGLTPLAVKGELQLSHLRPGNYAPYFAPFINLAVEDGKLDASGKFAVSMAGGKLQANASALNLALSGLRLAQPGEKAPLFTLAALDVSGGEFDLAKRSITLGELKTSAGKLLVVHDQDGKLNLGKLLPPAPSASAAPARPSAKAEVPWTVTLRKLAVEGYGVRLEDRAARRGIPLVLEPIALTADNLSTLKGARSNIAFKAGINRKGSANIGGTMALAPLQAALKLDVNGLELVPLQPFFGERLNVLVTRGALSAKGSLNYAAAAHAGAGDKAGFRGNLGVNNLAVIDRGNSADLLKWKSLVVGGVNAALGSGPFSLEVADVALNTFFARLVINPDGTLALQKLVKTADVPDTAAARSGAAVVAPAPTSPLASAPAYRVKVDKVRFIGGAVNFSDYFIKPNYSANLADINGSITGLSSEAGTTAGVELKGKLDGYAPVEVVGKVNPLAREVYLDLGAHAKGMELSGLTPYSERYAGYAIDKGKLSMDIRYSIENRLLKAENHLFLDQLTFGQRVESPDATKLPVLLAVALLKNSRGEIDINLPVGGSLDDPQFSVGGIIFQVVMNLLAKAVTSPFALLGSMFGDSE